MPKPCSISEARTVSIRLSYARYPALQATVLDLPEAIPTAAEILAREGMEQRVRHTPGNILDYDLGEGVYDVVLIALLVHHFTNEQNRDLAVRVARALKPGGVLMIMDSIRMESPADGGQPSRPA